MKADSLLTADQAIEAQFFIIRKKRRILLKTYSRSLMTLMFTTSRLLLRFSRQGNFILLKTIIKIMQKRILLTMKRIAVVQVEKISLIGHVQLEKRSILSGQINIC